VFKIEYPKNAKKGKRPDLKALLKIFRIRNEKSKKLTVKDLLFQNFPETLRRKDKFSLGMTKIQMSKIFQSADDLRIEKKRIP
jgi:hypothetical protein